MNDSELSISEGMHYNYMAVTKAYSYEKYLFLKDYGINKYITECERLRCMAGDFYYALKESETTNISKFYNDHASTFVPSAVGFNMYLTKVAFNNTVNIMPLKGFNKLKRLEKLYEEYKDEI